MRYLKIFFFVILITLVGFLANIFNQNFYEDKFEENEAYEKFGNDAFIVNNEVFGYFIFKNNLETNFFNEKEKEHLEDVRNLFVFGYLLLLTALINLFFIKKKEINEILLRSGIIGFSFILLLILISFTGFENFFTVFHKIFFNENSWIFAPEDNIVNLYTFDLFYDLFLRILLTCLFLFLFLIIFSVVKVKYQK